MNLNNLYFLDFDGTLFKTDAFWRDVCRTSVDLLGITEEMFRDTYTQSKSASTVYDINRHIELLGTTLEAFTALLETVLQRQRYAFPEVAPFLENHRDDTVVIVTQGIEWFQKAKIASVPGLDTIRTIVTDYKKRIYIENNIGFFENGVLWEGNHYKSLTFVDNMADAFLKEDHGPVFKQYRILRGADEDINAQIATEKHSTEITSLLDI